MISFICVVDNLWFLLGVYDCPINAQFYWKVLDQFFYVKIEIQTQVYQKAGLVLSNMVWVKGLFADGRIYKYSLFILLGCNLFYLYAFDYLLIDEDTPVNIG